MLRFLVFTRDRVTAAKTHLLVALVSGVGVFSSLNTAFAQSNASDLNRQIQLLKGIEKFVDRLYLPNIQVLTSTAEDCHREILKQGVNAETLDIIQSLQYLGLAFQYSSGTFSEISSEYLAPKITEILGLMKRIQDRHSLNRLEGSTIVKIIMDQMDRNVRQLQRSKLTESHTRRLQGLLDLLMDVRSKGAGGDNEVTYIAGDAVYEWFGKKSKDTDERSGSEKEISNRDWLLKLAISDDLRLGVESILVLNETYARYARLHEARQDPTGKRDRTREF
jgi:hypothetical protein